MGIVSMVSPKRVQTPHFQHLGAAATTQGSFYNLAFSEVHNHLGKPLMSGMNLDELLNTVINTGAAGDNNNTTVKNAPSPSSLSSSSSSSSPAPISFSQALNHKPVNEVWREIVEPDQGNVGGDGNEAFAQTTLEDFIIRHGGFDVVDQDIVNTHPLARMDPMSAEWLQFQMTTAQQQQRDQHMEVLLGSHVPVTSLPVGYSENQLAPSLPMVVASSSGIQTAPERKRRFSNEMMEKTIERRQKRMIKNRESAARSRARKQAYTNQLEHEVAQLRKGNKMLMNEKVCMYFN
ncbi:hypothetical protein IFM89_039325 [Coptis chinensis]|uniref:BZIP domain-containing protein n=1 Tax=Coptis chinensis TaxID=261450 RepID=A0A835LYC2_9MAGN|nr:hypothetical protein IFM89_039325 [Coptis chinensis]